MPAAIKAVLESISEGARFVVCGDIQSFFTRIPKSAVTKIVLDATGDELFTSFFSDAIHVELENIDRLRRHETQWPIEDIGVAQGNSLSPLLGNIVLAHFDQVMNEGDCRCIRYIDDIIILAPTERAANARLRKAKRLLAELGMALSPEKTSRGAAEITGSFDFLGINLSPGAIRPSLKAQNRFLASVDDLFENGRRSLNAIQNGATEKRPNNLLGTLKKTGRNDRRLG